ncbi:MAG: ABC transporter substrate-binding protein, partial [Aestuariivirgaceae bacterium]|nr:ABC transporter substrate-binding protein [Aestuariivirgaceae bacterium]
MNRRSVLAALAAAAFAPRLAMAGAMDWASILKAARGQTVYFHAWGGEQRINDFIAWAGAECEKRYGVTVSHVKLSDTADAVSRVLSEKQAGLSQGGSVDLIWINGANFASMKEKGLLLGHWAEGLPSFAFVDPVASPVTVNDFTIPVEGHESPWGLAQLVFYADTQRVATPPKSAAALLDYAKANAGRVTYPDPSNFLGASFLKQILTGFTADRAVLAKPVADFDGVTAPLWKWLDELHAVAWRQGRAFPQNGAELRQLVSDGETDIGISFDPAEVSASIAQKDLPESVRSFVFDGGMIGNAHFVAIPFNAAHKEGAMVFADFLLSPEGQARKQDPAVWGSFTVLAMDKLNAADRARFDAIDLGPAT